MTELDKIATALTKDDYNRFLILSRKIGSGSISRGFGRLLLYLRFNKRVPIVEKIIRKELVISKKEFKVTIDRIKEKLDYNNNDKIDELKRLLSLERKENKEYEFAPYLWSIHERSIPSSITMAGLTGAIFKRRINLGNDFNLKSLKDEIRLVKQNIEINKDEKTAVHYWGRVIEYLYKPYPNINVFFDPEGNLLRYEKEKYILPMCYVSLK
ncbi:MAG: hypothetical protein A2475_02575 [Ignavibacteria bacterium RIFOXYC2_FULL_35_21]|nr:MAG: hypothetical protein A2220_00090 [Ignavibacteria bacterium RIFOXYA2_FULL_35_10]OGV19321.1 MAG: hypothetical protein A2475_02575 [Ignavibacteria bacterium RIFOXYC2_FULL_35_21]